MTGTYIPKKANTSRKDREPNNLTRTTNLLVNFTQSYNFRNTRVASSFKWYLNKSSILLITKGKGTQHTKQLSYLYDSKIVQVI